MNFGLTQINSGFPEIGLYNPFAGGGILGGDISTAGGRFLNDGFYNMPSVCKFDLVPRIVDSELASSRQRLEAALLQQRQDGRVAGYSNPSGMNAGAEINSPWVSMFGAFTPPQQQQGITSQTPASSGPATRDSSAAEATAAPRTSAAQAGATKGPSETEAERKARNWAARMGYGYPYGYGSPLGYGMTAAGYGGYPPYGGGYAGAYGGYGASPYGSHSWGSEGVYDPYGGDLASSIS